MEVIWDTILLEYMIDIEILGVYKTNRKKYKITYRSKLNNGPSNTKHMLMSKRPLSLQNSIIIGQFCLNQLRI